MYSPDELPQGRQPYHGKTEVIASNHMEILDAMTVSDRAPVTHWEEKDDDPPMTGPYWRQRFDYLTKKLSVGVPMTYKIGRCTNFPKNRKFVETAYVKAFTILISFSFAVRILHASCGFMKIVLSRTPLVGTYPAIVEKTQRGQLLPEMTRMAWMVRPVAQFKLEIPLRDTPNHTRN